jgi:hypothetical protein
MNLVPGWRRVLIRAWSIRLALLAAVLSGVEVALPHLDFLFPRGTFAAISGVVTILAVVARLIPQPRSIPDEKA